MSSIYIPQNIQQFLKKLPAPIASLPILIIKRAGAENTTAEFGVRRQKVTFVAQVQQQILP